MTRRNNLEYVAMPAMRRCDECNEKGPLDSMKGGLCPRCGDHR